MSSVIERAGTARSGARPESRPLDLILPQLAQDPRRVDMQATWQAFCLEMDGQVQAAITRGQSPAEVAYAVGELVHNYFHARGVALTSHELRKLAGELMTEPARAARPPAMDDWGTVDPDDQPLPGPLVSFADEPLHRASRSAGDWTGEEPSPPIVEMSSSVFDDVPSPLVNIVGREEANFERLSAQTVARVRSRLPPATPREEALRAIDAAVDEVLREEKQALPVEARDRLVTSALGEICGLGPIDRLWADRSVRAIFVNGPQAVFVDRGSGTEAVPDHHFRDAAHLLEIARRLAPTGDVAEVKLRDGSGTVIFAPAAPDGPVLALRRAAAGEATFERLVAAGVLDAAMASLLRLAARGRLNVLVVGPEGSGKTALLAAIARDLDPASRLVTLGRRRDFRWSASGKVELLASEAASYATLLAAAGRLQPQLLVLDSVERGDISDVARHLAQGGRGVLVGCETSLITPALSRAVDIVVRLERGRDGLFRVVSLADAASVAVFVHEDGRFHRRSTTPAFAEILRAAGQGEALASLLG
ncbi:MAG TPA: ATPase, T2SS/T4P/T4SS family [Reyranella sp.]|nr:ATPase, T2SS/T4P/T4SS family [Reyranella sp.]